MSSFLKYMLGALLTIVGLFAAALVFVALIFDPNDYRPQITAAVDDATGRELSIEGDIHLSLFPWLGARARGVRLANAEGFGTGAMASVDAVEVRLRLWPLLMGEVEIGDVIVDGLTLNLERRADGTTNWDDLVGAEEQPAGTPPPPKVPAAGAAAVPNFAVAGVTVRNLHLIWSDAGAVTEVTTADLTVGALAPVSEPVVKARWHVRMPDGLEVAGELRTDLGLDLNRRLFEFDDFAFVTTVTGAAIPAGEQTVELRFDARFDAATFDADVPSLELIVAGQRITGQMKGMGLDRGGRASVTIDAPEIVFAAAAKTLALELPPDLPVQRWPKAAVHATANLDLAGPIMSKVDMRLAMGELRVEADTAIADLANPAGRMNVALKPMDLQAWLENVGLEFAGGPGGGPTALDMTVTFAQDSLQVANLRGTFDGAPLQGTASLRDFAAPQLRGDITLAALTVDRWMGKDTATAQAPAGQAAPPLDELELPMDWARDLNLTARAEIKELKAFGMTARDVVWSADARPGQPVTQQLAARAYGGQFKVANSIDAREPTPKLSLDLSAAAVAIGDLLKAGWGGRWITGSTQASLGLAGSGATVGALKTSAGGKAEYRVRDGQVFGVDLLHLIRSASAKLQQQAVPEAAGDATGFSELAGRMTVENGRVRFKELGGNNPWLNLGGGGEVDLFGGAWNLNLLPQLVDSDRTRNDKWLKKLLGRTIPVSVTGPLLQPRVKVDVDALVQQELKAQEQKLRDKADKKVEEKKDELRDKAREKLGDILRKL